MEQARYQIRFDWGQAGATAVGADADVVAWVDAIPDAAADPLARIPDSVAHVIGAGIGAAAAAAEWILDRQRDLGRPVIVAVIAAGADRADGGFRFAVEDQLAAGAIIAELGRLGLDATSPEAAAAEASFRGLERAVKHLQTASVSAVTAGASGAGVPSAPDAVVVLRTSE